MRVINTIILIIFLIPIKSFACDTTPVVTPSNVTNIGGGFWTVDINVCIGEGGSEGGFTTSFSGGINITAFTPSTLVDNNTATGSLAGGILDYNYAGAGPAPANMFVNPNVQTCFNYTVTLDGDPTLELVTLNGINSNHTGSCTFSPGIVTVDMTGNVPCFPDLFLTAPGSVSGNTIGAGDNYSFFWSDDQLIEVIIPCDDNWTFSTCGGATWDTWMFLSTSCDTWVPTIADNDDFCGQQSEITQFLTAGTYYIFMEAGAITFPVGEGPYILTVTSANPCNTNPCTYTVSAGSNTTICSLDTLTLSGSASGGVISTTWTTSGDGIFSNTTILNSTYIPGVADIAAGTVTLIITSDVPLDTNCTTVSDTLILTIELSEDASFNYSAASYCQGDSDPTPTISGTGSGTFTSTPLGLSITAGTGVIDLSMSTPGTYGVLYTTPGMCSDTLTVFVTISAGDDATFNYSASSYCKSDGNPSANITGTIGGIFTSTPVGLNISATTGLIDIVSSNLGTYGVLYTTPSALCKDTLTVFITINALPTITSSTTNTTVCAGDPVVLTGGGANSYSWDNGVTDGVTFVITTTTTYTVIGTDTNNCSNTDQISVTVNPLPVVELGEDTTICETSITLSSSGVFTNYLWKDGKTSSSITIDSEGIYTLTVTDANGCINTDEIVITEDCPFALWVPNVFTPNGDKLNDVFSAYGQFIEDYELLIFNRWGQEIFASNSIETGWNGTHKGEAVPSGAYAYIINYSYYNKRVLIRDIKKGHVTLLK